MQLLDHVSITVPDLQAARPFYDAVMVALGAVKVYDRADALGYGERSAAHAPGHSYFSVLQSPAWARDPRRHWCFKAPSRRAVDAFHRAGLAHGGHSEGAPGLRPDYHAHYYAAFLADPAGNRIEAACHLAGS
ncbi:glyoxalase [Bordetella genomosp. 7]|uniref:Glyoxalase n=1 Tax=Bordetella genomosp. 7 TaxID=1416805 RepID=A0A261QZ89_9BORD|nr:MULTISPECIES: VOC family protein [Bordetella]OZI18095.1 glyoxalase [Bordetella genomosp. 7]OZI21887.1 glyoxalase [Bordetella genomosp. 7]